VQVKLFSAPAATMIISNALAAVQLQLHSICLGYNNMQVSRATITLDLLPIEYFLTASRLHKFYRILNPNICETLW